jgi:hypothetical protein
MSKVIAVLVDISIYLYIMNIVSVNQIIEAYYKFHYSIIC